MKKPVRITLIVLAVVLGAFALVATGFYFGRATAWSGMMGGYAPGEMMDDYAPGGMMGGYAPGEMMGGYAPGGMMGGYAPGGMMGGYAPENAQPLTVDEARQAVQAYLDALGNDDLVLKEIMTFDNNAYAIVSEASTGVGALELLVDPATTAVFPEYGPNMMWNLKYGMHTDGSMMSGMMEGMMGAYPQDATPSADMPVSPEEALQSAQRFLDQYAPGVQVSDEITTFYGYYTIDTQKDGQIVGMLSVNGYTAQVFPHTWHGNFIAMSEE